MFKILRVAFFLAPKAILRGNLGITALTVFMLAIVAMNLLFVPGLIEGIVSSSNKILIETYSSDIIVESGDEGLLINHVKELINDIELINGVAAVSARNVISAQIQNKDERISCTVIGIEPEKDTRVFNMTKSIIEGKYLNSRDRDQIVLGVQLAGADLEHIELYSSSLKHVHAGDKIDVIFNNGQKRQYTVKGIFHSGLIQTDVQAFISELEFQSVIPAAKNKASSIRVKLEKDVDPNWIINQVGLLKQDLKFKKWNETAGIIQSMTDTFRIINEILNIVNILIAGITIFIVTYVDVVNRKRQIGIQRAIGIKPQSITLSYIFRALFYATLGLLIGILFYNYIMIPLEARRPFTFPFGPAFLSMNLSLISRTVVLLILVSLVASFIPVWRVMRKSILDAIWG